MKSKNNKKILKAKDHKKKHYITVQAIKKIPKVKFADIEDNHCKVINELAKNVLLISKNENNSNEVSITYNMLPKKGDTRIIGICLGTVDTVDPLSDTVSCHIITSQKECAVVSLHNHPSLTIISLSDINFFLDFASIKLMVVISNNGKLSYLHKSNKYNSKKAITLLNKLKKEHAKSIPEKGWHDASLDLVKEFLKSAKRLGIDYKKR